MSPPKTCMVCGDKALGYNFNAVTCESCKAFFRRNALAQKQFTCPFSQNCDITVVTRRFCQKCRLKKCLDIGMKSDNIMSEEDKRVKRLKIENNRTRRKVNEQHIDRKMRQFKQEQQAVADSSVPATSDTYDSQSCGSHDSAKSPTSLEDFSIAVGEQRSYFQSTEEVPTSSMTGAEIVEFIISDPDKSTQAINKLMRSPAEALATLEKVINSPSDALRLISHLISYPGNGLQIISKIVNSPFDALTVFTKFMSSPTDAIEIISKIVSSPQDVLLFVKQLMDSPTDALDIMNKFMNSPAEALKIINKMVSGSSSSQASITENSTPRDLSIDRQTQTHYSDEQNTLIHAMLIKSPVSVEPSNSIPPSSQVVQAPVISASQLGFHSDHTLQEDLSSNSGAGNSLGNFDILQSTSSSFPDYISTEDKNSLESVLTKVIRIEYETLGAFSAGPCVNQDFVNVKSFAAAEEMMRKPSYASAGITPDRNLNEAELLKLRELKIASEALYYPVDEDLNELVTDDVGIKPEGTHEDPKLLQVINLTAVAIKRLIKMAKKITAFRDLCQEDQVAVLKGGCIEMMLMRSVMTYDDNRNTWKIPHTKEDMSNIRADVLKLAKGNVYEEHLRFIRTFDEKWRMDENIILIMCAIILLTPSRARVIHSDVIRMEQNSYYYLLRRYLESIYSGCEAKSAYIKLIQKISDVERLNQFMVGVYLNVNPSQVEPLLREIFDMKNH